MSGLMANGVTFQDPTAITDEVWLGSPVYAYKGSLDQVLRRIPGFERRPFQLASNGKAGGVHGSLEAIVRLPMGPEQEIPVGVVSTAYELVQHRDVFRIGLTALERVDIPISTVTATLRLTELGERMELSLILPREYGFDPDGDRAMGLRLWVINSVDGSTRFQAVLGWLRFICRNGLVVGTTHAHYQRAHSRGLRIEDVESILLDGLRVALDERETYAGWMQDTVKQEQLRLFVDGPLRERWGVKAAARTYHIARTGRDATIVPPFVRSPPSQRAVKNLARVPGSSEPAKNLFDISQILSWLARDRRDLQEQLNWTRDISELMEQLQRN